MQREIFYFLLHYYFTDKDFTYKTQVFKIWGIAMDETTQQYITFLN